MIRMKFKENSNHVDGGDEGSITPLIAIYFTIAMLGIFILANVASTYVARRDLINLSEAALSKAAQELDEFAYYYQIPIPNVFGNSEQLIPINCSDAGLVFKRELFALFSDRPLADDFLSDNSSSRDFSSGTASSGTAALKISHPGSKSSGAISLGNTAANDGKPEIVDFSCDGHHLSAKVKSRHLLPFAANIFGVDSFTNEVSIKAVARFN